MPNTIIQQLIKKGLLEKDKAVLLEFEAKNSGRKEEEVLLEGKVVSESILFSLKADNLGVPFLEEILTKEIPLKVLEMIPEESAKYYKMIPLAKKDNIIEVGMVYPEDLRAQEALKFLSRLGKFTCQVFLIMPSVFNNLLKQYRTLRGEVKKALEELETELKIEKDEKTSAKSDEFERLVEEAPISKVVAVILRNAVEGGASDIHIEPTKEKLRVRFRLDGILHSSIILPLKVHLAVVARVKILSSLKIDETRLPQDGRFSIQLGDKDIDFRVSTFPTALGEKVALRILDSSEGLKSFTDLGLDGRNLKVVQESAKKPYGLILSTGPTGSGKTTTLYTILHTLNQEGVNIITLEDPVEYFIAGVNQSQIRPEIGYDFATGLRHILRQDPNIIMVGEIRDKETARLATNAALTGHIVLSTLHTNDAIGVIPRMIDLGVEPFLIPPTLSVAIAQRLVRKICPFCKEKVKPTKEVRDSIFKELDDLSPVIKKDLPFKITSSQDVFIFEAKGCKRCNFKGYSGRIALFEVLVMTKRLAEIVLEEPSEAKIFEEAKSQGMTTMKQDGILKILSGVTSMAEVLRVAEEK
ncbi:MAG: GspE/PulE family protein [Patescibacteria group bacterium]